LTEYPSPATRCVRFPARVDRSLHAFS
jgi:hypothetical protein